MNSNKRSTTTMSMRKETMRPKISLPSFFFVSVLLRLQFLHLALLRELEGDPPLFLHGYIERADWARQKQSQC